MNGRKRWTECSVCTRADIAEINAAILGGATVRAVAATFGIARSTLGLHKTRCGTAKATETPRATPYVSRREDALIAAGARESGIAVEELRNRYRSIKKRVKKGEEIESLRSVVEDSIELYKLARDANDSRVAVNLLPEIRNGLAKLHALEENTKAPEDSETAWFKHALFDEFRRVITGALEDELSRRAVAAALLGWERARTGESG